MKKIIIFTLVIIIIKTVLSNEFKLSDSKILLPRSSFNSINYTIKGSKSVCHDWSTSNPEIVTISPLYDLNAKSCSNEAVITSVWQSNHRITATIYAKNKATGHVVNCDVIVDLIDKLEIETRTQQLYLHETPEALIARGYDSLGNTFSTLDGIPFEWNIESSHKVEYQNVLRFITWTESEYTTPRLIGNLEKQGLHGFMQLVSGLKSGSANVSLTLRDDKIKLLIHSFSVRLLVMSKADLLPKVEYLMPHGQISYRILVHNQDAVQEVKLPSNQYYLTVNDSSVANLKQDSSTVVGIKFGQTEVILMDKNIKEDYQNPFAILYIREPGFLSFYIYPGENQWVLQSKWNNTYIITVRPFDLNSHPLYMSDNLRLETKIPKEYFKVLFSSLNGTYHIVEAIKEGSTTLRSTLKHIITEDGKMHELSNRVEGIQELVIYPPISVIPESVILPILHHTEDDKLDIPGFKLTATGGSGEYKWLINTDYHQNIVSVDSIGFVRPIQTGQTQVIAADQRNLNNQGYSKITVSLIAQIQLLVDRGVEVQVGEHLDVPIVALTEREQHMSHCHWLPFKTTISEIGILKIIQVLPSNNNDEACALLRIQGIQSGFTNIQLTLDTGFNESSSLSASITIGVYYPAEFVDPKSRSSSVALKSIREMRLINGPLPWILEPSSYYYDLMDEQNIKNVASKVRLQVAEPNSQYPSGSLILALQCIQNGTIDVKVKITNKPTQKNLKPRQSICKMKLSCTIPVRMKLVPLLAETISNKTGSCPFQNISGTHQQITVNNKSPLKVEIQFIDKDGMVFDRSDSLAVRVQIKNAIKTEIKIYNIVEKVNPIVYYVSDNFRSYFEVRPKQLDISTGQLIIEAICDSYRSPLSGGSATAAGFFSGDDGRKLKLESQLHVRLTRSISVEPSVIRLFQYPGVRASFSVLYGSGHFNIAKVVPSSLQVTRKDQYLERVDYEVDQQMKKSILDQFEQRMGSIQIIDSCFSTTEKHNADLYSNIDMAEVQVELVKPSRIQLLTMNKVQIGSDIYALVKIYDEKFREFPEEYLSLLQPQIHIRDKTTQSTTSTSTIITVQYNKQSISTSRDGFLLKITGDNIGFTTLSVSIQNELGREMMSNRVEIEVFPALELLPRQQLLLPGAEIQLSTIGGPMSMINSNDDGEGVNYNLKFGIRYNSTLGARQCRLEFVLPIKEESGTMESWSFNGLIRGLKAGQVSVLIRAELSELDPIRDNTRVVISQAEGYIGVVQIKSASIHTPIQTILFGNTIPAWVEFQPTTNDLGQLPISGMSITCSRSRVTTPPTFKWTLNPPQGVLVKMYHLLEPVNIHVDKIDRHSGMRITVLNSAGKQSVELTISNIPNTWLTSSTHQLIAKLDLTIISRLHMINPHLPMTRANTLLLPPDTRIHLRTSLDNIGHVSYSLSPSYSSNSFSSRVVSNNVLVTGGNNNNFNIHTSEHFLLNVHTTQHTQATTATSASSKSTSNNNGPSSGNQVPPTHSNYYGNQTMVIFVTVKQPIYSMINPSILSSKSILFNQLVNNVNKDYKLPTLPLGGPFEFIITSHDEHGDVFDQVSDLSKFSLRTHRSDRLSITMTTNSQSVNSENTEEQNYQHKIGIQTLQIQTLNSGSNTLQLYLPYLEQMTDVVTLPTGAAIRLHSNQPLIHKQINICEGMRIKLTSPIISNTQGNWYASDNSLVTISKNTGYMVAKSRGTVTIYYTPGYRTKEEHGRSEPVLVGHPIQIVGTNSILLADLSSNHDEDELLNFYPIKSINKNNANVPISFNTNNYRPRKLVPIYLKSSNRDLLDLISESENFSPEFHNENTPIKCSLESQRYPQLIQLLDIQTVAIPTKKHPSTESTLAQWACLLQPRINVSTQVIINTLQSIHNSHDQYDDYDSNMMMNDDDEYRVFIHAKLIVGSSLDNVLNDKLPVALVAGYQLLPTSSLQSIELTTGGQVSTDIRLIIPPVTLRMSSKRSSYNQISVISSRPHMLEVLAPRKYNDVFPTSTDSISGAEQTPLNKNHVWIYPIKAALTDGEMDENVTIVIRLPITNQEERIKVHLSIHSNTVSKSIRTHYSTGGSIQTNENSTMTMNIIRSIFYVVITAIFAVVIVILVNLLLRPVQSDIPSTTSSQSPHSYNHPLIPPRRLTTTQHIWSSSSSPKQHQHNTTFSSGNNSFTNSHNSSMSPNSNSYSRSPYFVNRLSTSQYLD